MTKNTSATKIRKSTVASANSRTSTTIYRIGSAAGTTGPTAFLPPGKELKKGYTDEFLVRHGAPPGSTIAMTLTGYMTEDAWVELSPKMAAGIRKLKVIDQMPHWWVLNILDGFGPHVSSLKAMEIYDESKILVRRSQLATHCSPLTSHFSLLTTRHSLGAEGRGRREPCQSGLRPDSCKGG